MLRENGIEPEIIDYLKTPPTAAAVGGLLKMLKIPAHDLLRVKEDEYKSAGLSPNSTDTQIKKAIAANPILLERPIVVKGSKALVARPPELVLSLI